ncbi:MAG: citrate lyase subunit beta [Alphaproteobacteria bacterium]|nr:MAG: citrate lyase subunit beta [Alphaproteobacteria bacterium]
MRPMQLRRSWLFVGAADKNAILTSYDSGADVCIQEFEDFCLPELRREARLMMPDVLSDWRARKIVATVRINPLEDPDGLRDLDTAMRAGADAILLPKANTKEQIVLLQKHINEMEKQCGKTVSSTKIIPNIEQARGLMNATDILSSSTQIAGALVASEDMVVSLNAPRKKNSEILNHVRRVFHIACCSVGITSIDMPYTFTDDEGVRQQTMLAKDIGMLAKSTVNASHCKIINEILTPNERDVENAVEIVSAFEKGRGSGEGQVIHKGTKIEVPIYLNAKQIIERFEALSS